MCTSANSDSTRECELSNHCLLNVFLPHPLLPKTCTVRSGLENLLRKYRTKNNIMLMTENVELVYVVQIIIHCFINWVTTTTMQQYKHTVPSHSISMTRVPRMLRLSRVSRLPPHQIQNVLFTCRHSTGLLDIVQAYTRPEWDPHSFLPSHLLRCRSHPASGRSSKGSGDHARDVPVPRWCRSNTNLDPSQFYSGSEVVLQCLSLAYRYATIVMLCVSTCRGQS